MKRAVLILGTLVSLNILVSCSEWLTVEPKAEIELGTMHETEQGIKDALIGCYIQMSNEALYGGELTHTFMEVLGQQFSLLGLTASPYYDASRYIYTGSRTEGIIEGIWAGLYNVIANVNALIEGLEKNREMLRPSVYALAKAEAYSLRAFCYLDLVRLFTPGNLIERPEKLNELAIPYIKIYDKNIQPRETLGNVLKYIHEDLEIAMDLFDQYDPLSKRSVRPEDYEDLTKESFYKLAQRKYRMTIRGAMATRLRLNMWEGNYAAAKQDAEALIATNTLPFLTEMTGASSALDLTFSAEMLFGVETFKRFDNVIRDYFSLTEGEGSQMNYNALYLSQARVDELYEIKNGVGVSDWRYMHLWDKTTPTFVFLKYWEYEDMVHINNMPLIKTPEIYYTLAECLLREGGSKNRNDAITRLNTVRNHRNIPVELNLPYNLTEEEAWNELVKEMRKEYIGEGQMFFYYKRVDATSIPNGPGVNYGDNVYVLPMPQSETDLSK